MPEQSPAQSSFTRAHQPILLSAALCLCHHLGGLGRARDSFGDPRLRLCARPPPCLSTLRAAAAGRQEEGRSAVPTCFWGTPRTSRGPGLWGEGPGARPVPHSLCSLSPPVTRSGSSHPWVPRVAGPPPSCTAAGTCSAARWPLGSSWGSSPPPQSLPFPAHHPELPQVRGWRVCSSQDWGRESSEARTRRPRGGGRSMLGRACLHPPSCGSRGPVWVWALLPEPCPRARGS